MSPILPHTKVTRPFIGALVTAAALSCYAHASWAGPHNCTAESSAVFNQALSTHRAVLNEVLASKRRGRWHPDGTYRSPFFSHSARVLRDIKSMLILRNSDEGALLRPFRLLLATRLPDGERLPKTLRRRETARVRTSVQAYIACQRAD